VQGAADYARAKASIADFASEGGPAIVRVQVPQNIAGMAFPGGGVFDVQPGYGLEELQTA
jgi:hypothetical protein